MTTIKKKNPNTGLWEYVSSAQADAILTSQLDTDGALTANSDSKVPSQQAVKEYADLYRPKVCTLFRATKAYTSADVEKALQNIGYDIQTSAADGDYCIIPVYCVNNETIMDLSWQKAASRGIFNIYINNVLDSSGYDGYAASATALASSITLTQPLLSGWNEIKIKINGKNASAIGYNFNIYGVRIR